MKPDITELSYTIYLLSKIDMDAKSRLTIYEDLITFFEEDSGK
jgi:hypothetical protein